MKTCLVVFYSRTGMTRVVADAVAKSCGCDIEAIREPRSRAGMLGYLYAGYEAVTKKLPAIKPAIRNPADYDITILGTPVWGQNVSSPMRSYIMQNGNRFNRIAAFCTMGGAGGDKALDGIAALCSKPLAVRLVLTDAQINDQSYLEKVGEFARSLEVMA